MLIVMAKNKYPINRFNTKLILIELLKRGSTTSTRLAERIGCTKVSLCNTLRDLRERGMVEFTDEGTYDAREKPVKLTTKGKIYTMMLDSTEDYLEIVAESESQPTWRPDHLIMNEQDEREILEFVTGFWEKMKKKMRRKG